MSLDASVVLVGLSGTGKSTVAEWVASRAGLPARDLDSLVEDDAGASVARLFADRGEAGFRRLELEALRRVLAGPPAVIATGGGVVTTPGARDLLSGRTVLWLRARTDTLVERLAGDGVTRPLLWSTSAGSDASAGSDLAERLEAMVTERTPLYAEVATDMVDVDGLTVDQVGDRVLELVAADASAGGRR